MTDKKKSARGTTLSWSDIEIVKRHPTIFTKDRAAVLVIDMQEKLLPAMSNRYDLIRNSELLLSAAAILNVPVIVTEQYPKGLGRTVERLSSLICEGSFIEKNSFSAVGEKNFLSILEEARFTKFAMIGVEAHVCVLQTALDLQVRGFEVSVCGDAVSSRKSEDKELALRRMERAGITVSSVEGLIFEMLERADSEEFKKILELVR